MNPEAIKSIMKEMIKAFDEYSKKMAKLHNELMKEMN